jgi:hypothetical protein
MSTWHDENLWKMLSSFFALNGRYLSDETEPVSQRAIAVAIRNGHPPSTESFLDLQHELR